MITATIVQPCCTTYGKRTLTVEPCWVRSSDAGRTFQRHCWHAQQSIYQVQIPTVISQDAVCYHVLFDIRSGGFRGQPCGTPCLLTLDDQQASPASRQRAIFVSPLVGRRRLISAYTYHVTLVCHALTESWGAHLFRISAYGHETLRLALKSQRTLLPCSLWLTLVLQKFSTLDLKM